MIVPGSASPLLTTTDGGYTIAKSLRFRSSASAYLNRTLTTPTNNKIFTISFWFKIGSFYPWANTGACFLNAKNTNSIGGYIQGYQNNPYELGIGEYNTSAWTWSVSTSAVYRDPSAWYHAVFAVDTTQATASNRVKIYVNGVLQTALASAVYPSQNSSTYFNSALTNYIGSANGTSQYFDGQMTDYYFIDGQQLTASSFGETDSVTGVWKPKAYSGTYGTNGFYLKFTDVATTSGSNAGLGKDFSGNGNYWTTNNISVTSGSTYDSMKDVPTLTDADTANYCVGNPLSVGANTSLSNANLSGTLTGSGGWAGTICGLTSGKWYYEATPTANSGNSMWIGFLSDVYTKNDNAWSYSTQTALYANDARNGNNTSYGATYTTNDVIGVAIDLSTSSGSITFYKNGVSQGVMFSSLTTSAVWRPLISGGGTGTTIAMNFGQRPFAYTPPTGYKALNTYNLPDSTIVAGNKVMDATTYTGTGSAITVTNAGAFKPDFVWVKARSFSSGGVGHMLADSVRGGTKVLHTDQTAAEQTNLYGAINTFNSNGFTTLAGSTNSAEVHDASMTYVGWQWQAGQGTTSSNTNGSITSTVSVNASAGFSIVTYTGNGTNNATVGHGLGVTPAMIIAKNRTTGSTFWPVYHKSFSSNYVCWLNSTLATQSITSTANGGIGSVSSSIFTCINGTSGGNEVNASTNNYVAYCWAEIAGFSNFGSYTGNGSSDGPFIYTGFRPKFVLFKAASGTSVGTDAYWNMIDTSRGPFNYYIPRLAAQTSAAEDTGTVQWVDILSNGFKMRNSGTSNNNSGTVYIYAAFAENPFKNALAR